MVNDGRQLSLAFLAPPAVHAVRFVAKVALVWFIAADELGTGLLVGLVAHFALHIAMWGLDDAIVQARDLNADLWRRAHRLHRISGTVVAALVMSAGAALGALLDDVLLGRALIAIGPSVAIANMSILPTALLVRKQRYGALFGVDVGSVIAFACVTVVSAICGAGAWSLVLGWYAQGITSFVMVAHASRDLIPTSTRVSSTEPEELFRFGRDITGANALGFVSERVDSGVVGFALGRAALGLYEWALHVSLVTVNLATSLSERVLLPTLADHRRRGTMADAYAHALRLGATFFLPACLVLALVAQPLVDTALPAEWSATGPLLAVLCLAAGARVFDVVSVTALKAGGWSGDVVRLSAARLAILATFVSGALTFGTLAVASAVCAARLVVAVWAVRIAHQRVASARVMSAAPWHACAAWAVAVVPSAAWLRLVFAETPVYEVAAIVAVSSTLWVVARHLFDRAQFERECRAVRTFISAFGEPTTR